MFDAVTAGKAEMAQHLADAKRHLRDNLVTLLLFGIRASLRDCVWAILRGACTDETLAETEPRLCLPPQA